ncbi:Gfo/Idh/MocA family oxidoreductase, partial [bacterium]|nr:Gfo/Idh/MocA family oxidoreductase [bacterium]
MSEQKVRIAFVGVGSMGQCAHLKNYATLPECEVVALAEVKEELGRNVAAKYGVPRVYRDAAEMIEKEKGAIDGIVASQPFNRHGIIVPGILKAGVPVFTEKPLAASVQVGERIVDAVSKGGTWHMLGYHKRSDPAVMAAKAEIDRLKASGELGAMRYVRILMPAGDWIESGFNDRIGSSDPNPQFDWDPPAQDMDGETFGQYTSFVNYYIHQVNLMRHLLGEPYAPKYADRAGVLLVGESAGGI